MCLITSKLYLPLNASVTKNNNYSQITEETGGEFKSALAVGENTALRHTALQYATLEQVGLLTEESGLLPERLLERKTAT